jgi:hypothetical protein
LNKSEGYRFKDESFAEKNVFRQMRLVFLLSYKILFFKPLKKVNYFVDKRNKNLYNREALLSKNLIIYAALAE